MNYATHLMLSAAAVAALSFSSVATVEANEVCQDLLAGQTINVGEVCVSNDEDTITVVFTTENGWEMSKADLYIGDWEDGVPLNNGGNLTPAQLPYKQEFDPSVTTITFSFSMSNFGLTCDSLYLIAAHADVSKGTQTETAWGEGTRASSGNWSMYFGYQAVCPDDEPPPPLQVCEGSETGYAFSDTRFSAYGASNWGWVIEGVEPGDSGSAVIYAGAGNYSGGTAVGTFEYDYGTNGFFSGTFIIDSAFGLLETHLHVGADVPRHRNGRVQLAPGQFNFNGNRDTFADDGATYYGEVAGGGTVKVIAHSVTCTVQ